MHIFGEMWQNIYKLLKKIKFAEPGKSYLQNEKYNKTEFGLV